KLLRAVEQISILEPDFAVFCGDMVCFARSQTLIDRFRDTVSELRCPVRYTCGNHDILMSEDEIGLYRRNFGMEYGSYEYNNSLFINLNTCCMEKYFIDRAIARRQYEWLDDVLQASESQRYDHIFVICHVPFLVYSPDEEDNNCSVLSEFRGPFLDLLEKYGVEYVLAGHTHREFDVTCRGTRHLTSTTLMWPSEGQERAGFRVFKVYPQKIENYWITLKDRPEKISF
ncbi:MAG: metallophosphoesterase, partial [Abditibacteriota bacterium]|nr:metallophosphoesterase [Abditibacteriota bacterium]